MKCWKTTTKGKNILEKAHKILPESKAILEEDIFFKKFREAGKK